MCYTGTRDLSSGTKSSCCSHASLLGLAFRCDMSSLEDYPEGTPRYHLAIQIVQLRPLEEKRNEAAWHSSKYDHNSSAIAVCCLLNTFKVKFWNRKRL
ncbi:hypothetical protein NPIL_438451 [Nephila pilipes]|uniref:Uncharacterized protein n=1 Tax=Nephila pilipes TaxID=299642 RepID=A0A8X6QH98_NEPPI|nr:hypothetical protein NPIL_438451 [Nephila pilipes]